MQQTSAVTKGFGSSVIFVVILIIGSFELPSAGAQRSDPRGSASAGDRKK
jgi:hypothetical protein